MNLTKNLLQYSEITKLLLESSLSNNFTLTPESIESKVSSIGEIYGMKCDYNELVNGIKHGSREFYNNEVFENEWSDQFHNLMINLIQL